MSELREKNFDSKTSGAKLKIPKKALAPVYCPFFQNFFLIFFSPTIQEFSDHGNSIHRAYGISVYHDPSISVYQYPGISSYNFQEEKQLKREAINLLLDRPRKRPFCGENSDPTEDLD